MPTMTDERQYLADSFETETDLGVEERETNITFSKADEHATVYTIERAVARSLVLNDEATIVHVDHADHERTESVEAALDHDSPPVAVEVRVPIGCITVKSSARASNNVSQTVSATHSTKAKPAQLGDD